MRSMLWALPLIGLWLLILVGGALGIAGPL